MNNTVKALVSRGLDTEKATELSEQGITLSELKQKDNNELLELGLDLSFIDKIRLEKRPPIQNETIINLFLEVDYCCTLCRKRNLSLVIHHITPWNESRSHDIENLIVLCLNCHGEAHTKREIGKNLTPDILRAHKIEWVKLVSEMKSNNARGIASHVDNQWHYFNLLRLFEFFDTEGIDTTKTKYFNQLLLKKWVDENGNFTFDDPKRYWLNFGGGYIVCLHLKELFGVLISRKEMKTINDLWDKQKIIANLKVGDFFLMQGAFSFRCDEEKNVYVRRKYNDIVVSSKVDSYYFNSESAGFILSGRKVKTIVGVVRGIENEGGNLVVTCTSLAIGDVVEKIESGRATVFSYNSDEYDELDEEESGEFEVITTAVNVDGVVVFEKGIKPISTIE